MSDVITQLKQIVKQLEEGGDYLAAAHVAQRIIDIKREAIV